ncbi:MAG: permease [Deltaproteobacteria bacterium]|nr:permease [Deltaproteobacteria bacterium]
MMVVVFEALEKILLTSIDILNDVSPWLIISFIVAGGLHNFLSPARLQHLLGNRRLSTLIKATLSGMLLPICSCGVIPLGLGLYYTGAYLGPTLAFMVATPIINPAAVLLAYGLLGPQLATIYLISGFCVPILVGMLANRLAGDEIHAPGMDHQAEISNLDLDSDVSLAQRLYSGLHWGFMDLGVMSSKYIVLGIPLAGFLIAIVPPSMIQRYLGDPGMISIAGIAVLGSVLYVCAVGHIPFVAALVASGAAPGVAITFLMTGAATNLPELISIYKIIGKRAMIIYALTMVSAAMMIGLFTNAILMPDFIPFFDLEKSRRVVGMSNWFVIAVPDPVKYLCSVAVVFLCCYPWLQPIRRRFARAEA